MWDILRRPIDFEKYVGQKVYVRFDINPKTLTCCGNIEKFLQHCADQRNKLKDGFYMLIKIDNNNSYHSYAIDLGDEEIWSTSHNFINEIYGIKK